MLAKGACVRDKHVLFVKLSGNTTFYTTCMVRGRAKSAKRRN